MYDKNNIFAKIIRGEVPCDKIYEDEFTLAFKDINPQTKIHVLVIPKGFYKDMNDFSENATKEEVMAFFNAIVKVVHILGIKNKGYRCINNNGNDGGQEVPHLHFHILGGQIVGRMVSKN